MKCKCCISPHKDFIESLLAKGISTRKVSKRLKEKYDVYISHSSINNHRKYHWLPYTQGLDRQDIILLLYETGNHRLARSILKTQKIVKTYPKCNCSPFLNRKVKKRGLVFICTLCNGWLESNLGRAIRYSMKKKEEPEDEEPLSFSIKLESRYY